MNVRDRPSTATTDVSIANVHQMVLDDRRIKVREIAEVMNMSKDRVCHVKSTFRHEKAVRTFGAAFAHSPIPEGALMDNPSAHKKCKVIDQKGTESWSYFNRKGKTITGAYYVDKLTAELAEKRPYLQKKKILFHQDNSPSHTIAVAMAKNP
ncbi:histone-lysine N-methyltransferase SETMAR [Trichonephila clavipes]|uniref:Histone-lysine N-methyltransferase SETMAR n=1 Tax=Trichonephila clavipes TaxID=2585209 RepID=A0A8X6T1C4_TRICX|nr:histone-lysine N-methyltransferase SETMAR [Trichonephila clavipes]